MCVESQKGHRTYHPGGNVDPNGLLNMAMQNGTASSFVNAAVPEHAVPQTMDEALDAKVSKRPDICVGPSTSLKRSEVFKNVLARAAERLSQTMKTYLLPIDSLGWLLLGLHTMQPVDGASQLPPAGFAAN